MLPFFFHCAAINLMQLVGPPPYPGTNLFLLIFVLYFAITEGFFLPASFIALCMGFSIFDSFLHPFTPEFHLIVSFNT